MGRINPKASDPPHFAWPTNDTFARWAQSTSPVEARSTRSPDSPHLPPPRSAQGTDEGRRSSRKAFAESFSVSQDKNYFCRLPNELLHQIGKELAKHPKSSPLRAAAGTNRRFHEVFSPLLDRWVQEHNLLLRGPLESALFNATDGGKGLKDKLAFIRRQDLALKSWAKHRVIDYIETICSDDAEKSIILAELLNALHGLETWSGLPTTAARLIKVYNELPPDKQGRPLSAFAGLIRHLLPEAKGEVREILKLHLDFVTSDRGRRHLQELFLALPFNDAELSSCVEQDVIDYIEKTCTDDAAKSIILTEFLYALPKLDAGSVGSIAARLVSSHNGLPPDKQGAPMVAFAELIGRLPHEDRVATEACITDLTEMLSINGGSLSAVLRQKMLIELARTTPLVSDEKKPAHVYSVAKLILRLPKDLQEGCLAPLEQYLKYLPPGARTHLQAKHDWQRLSGNVRKLFSSRRQRQLSPEHE